MSSLIGRTWFRRSGLALAAVLSVGALTAASQPADARVWVGFGAPFGGYYYAPPPPPVYSYPAYYGYGWNWRHARWCRWHPYAPGCRYW